MPLRPNPRPSAAYTLVEMLAVLLLVALLTGLALPAYHRQVQKARRSEALVVLAQLQARQERWHAANGRYASADELALASGETSPYYAWTVPLSDAQHFLLRASASERGAQHQDRQGDVSCARLEIDQSGTRTPAACWPQ